jgi:formyltetrahydrofolate deformylase
MHAMTTSPAASTGLGEISTERGADGGEQLLTLHCPDRPGIVHAVSGFLAERGCNILDSQQFGDPETGRFFMRVHLVPLASPAAATSAGDLQRDFAEVAEQFAMEWTLVPVDSRTRTVIMVSREGHCLNDLLFRWRSGTLPVEVVAVVSNHPDLATIVEPYGVPFHVVPVSAATKPDAEARLLALVDELGAELVVLARYMQVLSPELCERLAGRVINIHHSFLPGFSGARPYHQAHQRGVKIIGATAHYVTAVLDDGPIIEQDVVRVRHDQDPAALAAAGRDVECQVLARAVRWHCERRVLRNGLRTVVFR